MTKKKVVALSCLCADVYDKVMTAGGETLNFAANCCHHSHLQLYIIGVVGKDEFGKEIINSIKDKNIDTTHLYVLDGDTVHNRTYLTDKGEKYYTADSFHSGIMMEYTLSDSDKELIKSADLVHITAHSPNLDEVLQYRKCYSFPLSIDLDTRRDYENWREILPLADFIFVSGNDEVIENAGRLSKEYKDAVITVTLAEKGSVTFKGGKRYSCEAVKVSKVVDTTGCGDSFAAGFLSEYLLSGDIKKAMQSGAERASITLGFIGGFKYKDSQEMN